MLHLKKMRSDCLSDWKKDYELSLMPKEFKGGNMNKINWKILNLAFWTELVLSYLLPFKVTDDCCYEAGFPLSFLSVYDTKFGVSPFMSMSLNPIALLLNVFLIDFIMLACIKGYLKFKRDRN